MDHIGYNVPISIVEILFSNPNSNLINPLEVKIGRNTNFTDINRMYIKPDVSEIPKTAIISYAAIRILVLETTNDDGDQDANIMGFLVTSKVDNIDSITWNNMPSFDISSSFFNKDIHGNSIIMIDITKYIKGFLDGTIENNGFIFVNQETTHNEAILDNDVLNGKGISIIVQYYDPNELFIENSIDINVNSNEYYTNPILVSYIADGVIFVKNLGDNLISATIEVSGNGVDFVEDNYIQGLSPNNTKILTSYYWAKYIRLRLRGSTNSIKANIILQGHYI